MPRRSRVSKQRGLNKKQLRQVKSAITRDSEIKHHDTQHTAISVIGSGTISNSCLGTFTPGTGSSGRIGDEITVRNMHVRMAIVSADTTNFVRVIWFQWYQNNGSQAPAANAILQNSSSWLSPLNDTNEAAKLFKVMSDKTYSFSDGGRNCLNVTKTFYGRGIPRKQLEFSPGSSQGFNQFYYLVISDSIAAPNPTVTVWSRVNYVDK